VTELQVIARHTVKEGELESVLALLDEFIPLARSEPGNVDFVAYRRFDDPLSYVLLERYTGREAFDVHRETPHFRTLLLEQIVPRLDARTVETYDVIA
jgi:quinol monooxygenase YgiN